MQEVRVAGRTARFGTSLRLWWRLGRPVTLTASVVPVLVGGSLAAHRGSFDVLNGLLLLVGSLLVQVATNIFNEYYDYRRGVDTPESVGIAGVIVEGQVRPETVLRGGVVCFAVAFVLGLWLVARTGWPVLAAGLLSALAAWAYSGGPRPIASTPFGEVEVFVFMGLVQVGLGYFVHAGRLDWSVLWAALPVGLLVAAILLTNNLRDMDGDAARGRRTLPIVLGRTAGLGVLAAMLGAAYLLPTLGVALGILPWQTLLVWATVVLAPGVVRPFTTTAVPKALNLGLRRAALLHLRFGIVFSLGFLAAALMG